MKSPRRLDFSVGQLREIARLKDEAQQLSLVEECEQKDLSVKELRSRVNKLLNPGSKQEKEPKAVPAFQFHWKGRELSIKVRTFRPDQELWPNYASELDEAVTKFRAAFPLSEVKAEEVAQAA